MGSDYHASHDPQRQREALPGLLHGSYVTLGLTEFREAYLLLAQGIEHPESLPHFQLPERFQDLATGETCNLQDTAFMRAWIVSGESFRDDAKRVSFHARVDRVLPLATADCYAAYVDHEESSIHVALLLAILHVPFSMRTPDDVLALLFDSELRSKLANVAGEGTARGLTH